MKLAELAPSTKSVAVAKEQPPIEAAASSLLHHLWASIAATLILVIICCVIYPLLVWGIAQLAFPVQANGSLLKKDGAYTTDEKQAVGSALLGQNFTLAQYFHPRPSQNNYDAANSSGSNLGPISDKFLNGASAMQPATPPATTTQPTETLAFDGVRLRVLHYAVDNNIQFKFYYVQANKDGTILSKAPVPAADLPKFQDKGGNLLDLALVDAFPHVAPSDDPADKTYQYLITDDFSTPIPADAVTASGSGLDPHISPENAALQTARIAKARNLSEDAVKKLIDQYTDRPNLGIFGDPGVNVLRLNLALDQTSPMPPATSPASAPATAK